MKTLFTCISVCFFFFQALAQGPNRNVRFKSIGKDSINLHFDPDYFLIEDTCSSIVRYGRFNFQERYFFGDFRDLNKFDPQIILAEGRYSPQGKLDGDFTMRYLNGQLQAKGNFKDGLMQNAWEFFFDTGYPRLKLSINNGLTVIEEAWNTDGKKQVTNGAGTFRVDQSGVFWEGKLTNGLPEGTWKCRGIEDRTGTVLTSEVFKNNKFIKGSGPLGAYRDASRISLISENLLPIRNAAKMMVSATACNPLLSRRKVVYAVYRNGFSSYNEEIKRLVGPVFGKKNLVPFGQAKFDVDAEISEKGNLINLRAKNSFDEKLSSSIIRELSRLPDLEPALIDGKAVKSKMLFSFEFNNGLYKFQYRLLPMVIN